MKPVYLFFAEGSEEVEALAVVDILRRAGIDIKIVSVADGRLVTGSHGIKVEADENRKRALSENAEYVKDKGKFFGVLIADGELSIQVLKSVTEFFEEGESMHHCVFANEYYKKKDSLILSAKVAGERKETIEVNLKTFSIVQSRSAFNKSSEYHARIIELMNKNMNLIRQCV